MSLTPNQNISLTDALSFFPKFEGNPSELIDFLNCCKEAKSVLPEAAEGNLTKLIYGSKLGAKVKTSLNIAVPVTIAGLTSELKKIYVPNKTLFQLQGELGRMYQKDTESVVEFFFATRGAKIDYKNKLLKMDGEKFPFRQANRVENGVMYIPPRSESTFFIEVQNPEVREGFIPKLRICKGVFAGNCLVRINNMNRAYLQIYNTTEEEVAVKIPNLAV
ncbi:GSCOCG00012378001-RA-CDS, partial [Cotesia congregata]